MAANGQLVFTDVDKVTFKGVGDTSNAVIDTTTGKIGVGVDSPDANLHVLGNCFVSTNLELGGTMTMGTVTVNARHELSAITATGNTTPHTVEFQNATTGLVTTGNVEVGKDLTVTGNVAVDTDTLFVDSVNDRVGVGTTTPGSALDVVGDAAISSNLVVANSRFSLDTNGTLKQVGDANSKYIKLMKYFADGSNWKIATGSYTGPSYQWVSIRANITRLDQDVEIIQFNYLGHNGTSHVRDPIIIGGGATSTQANEIKVYNKTSNSTYEIYLQIDSATSVEVEITHRNSTIDDDYSTVATANNGAIDETGLTKIYDSGTTTDLRLKEGNVGIGTTDPQGGLHIDGKTFILGQIATAPSGPDGTMYYNSATNQPLVKVNGSWVSFVSFSPPNISGLVGWYLPENWTGSQWSDVSGSGNHVTAYEGTIQYDGSRQGSSDGANSTFPVLYGSPTAELNFPSAILPSTYTLISLTRYHGSTKKRILDGQNGNWLSGHWSGSSGVAYHNGFLTPTTDRYGSKWVIGVDQNYLYRSKSQSVAWTNDTGGGGTSTNLRLGSVDYEGSDWMCAELIVYNRTLSSDEYTQVSDYIQNKFGIY